MIDKRISYRFGGGYQGRDTSPSRGPAGGASSGGNYGGNTGGNQSGGGGGGGGGGDAREQYIAQQYTAPAPASVYKDPDPVTETVPGDTEPKPEKYTGPKITPHRDTGEEKEPYEMVKGVEVPLSMRGVKGVDPREDPERYFEKILPIDKVMSKDERFWTIEDKRIIEDWEKEQDWDKVKELADRGHSSDDIQKAMDKGLLLKQDALRRQGLIERGLAAIKPETRLESSLIDTVKKTFDPRRLATNFALKKMGLSWLNPLMGLASLFFPKKTAGIKTAVKSRFGQQPKDMSAFSNLGLYADRQPTDTIQQARVGQGTIGSDIVAGTKGILESGQELLGLKDIEGQQAKVVGPALIQMRMLERKVKAPGIYGKPTPKEERMYQKLREMDKEEKVYSKPILTAADGGRIDKALGGRVRDI